MLYEEMPMKKCPRFRRNNTLAHFQTYHLNSDDFRHVCIYVFFVFSMCLHFNMVFSIILTHLSSDQARSFLARCSPVQRGLGPVVTMGLHEVMVIHDDWMMTGGTPMTKRTPPSILDELLRCDVTGMMSRIRGIIPKWESDNNYVQII